MDTSDGAITEAGDHPYQVMVLRGFLRHCAYDAAAVPRLMTALSEHRVKDYDPDEEDFGDIRSAFLAYKQRRFAGEERAMSAQSGYGREIHKALESVVPSHAIESVLGNASSDLRGKMSIRTDSDHAGAWIAVNGDSCEESTRGSHLSKPHVDPLGVRVLHVLMAADRENDNEVDSEGKHTAEGGRGAKSKKRRRGESTDEEDDESMTTRGATKKAMIASSSSSSGNSITSGSLNSAPFSTGCKVWLIGDADDVRGMSQLAGFTPVLMPVIRPGDAMIVPPGLPHAVYSIGACLWAAWDRLTPVCAEAAQASRKLQSSDVTAHKWLDRLQGRGLLTQEMEDETTDARRASSVHPAMAPYLTGYGRLRYGEAPSLEGFINHAVFTLQPKALLSSNPAEAQKVRKVMLHLSAAEGGGWRHWDGGGLRLRLERGSSADSSGHGHKGSCAVCWQEIAREDSASAGSNNSSTGSSSSSSSSSASSPALSHAYDDTASGSAGATLLHLSSLLAPLGIAVFGGSGSSASSDGGPVTPTKTLAWQSSAGSNSSNSCGDSDRDRSSSLELATAHHSAPVCARCMKAAGSYVAAVKRAARLRALAGLPANPSAGAEDDNINGEEADGSTGEEGGNCHGGVACMHVRYCRTMRLRAFGGGYVALQA